MSRGRRPRRVQLARGLFSFLASLMKFLLPDFRGIVALEFRSSWTFRVIADRFAMEVFRRRFRSFIVSRGQLGKNRGIEFVLYY